MCVYVCVSVPVCVRRTLCVYVGVFVNYNNKLKLLYNNINLYFT